MVDATFDRARSIRRLARANLRYVVGRVGVYAFLGLFAFIYLCRCSSIVANSFRALPEITRMA